jgi:hypothetical protein
MGACASPKQGEDEATMQISYLTKDDVNLACAGRKAAQCGATLAASSPEMDLTLCRAAAPSLAVCPPLTDGRQDSPEAFEDPAALCASVRSLAFRASRVLRRDAGGAVTSSEEVTELLDRVAHLEHHVNQFRRLHNVQLEDLRRWISSLRRRIE